MNRMQEIDEFLKYHAEIFAQNPQLQITEDMFYSSLENYGLSESEKHDKNIKSLFNEWVEYFKYHDNIKVYHDIRQSRFLQFQKLTETCRNKDAIKMYIPFNKEKIESCVKILFDYLDKNKISHMSKVADNIRSDSVVLRIYNQEDAIKIIKYVEKNPDLFTNISKINPFLMNNNKIGMAIDDYLSYNGTVALLLKLYFEDKKSNNNFNEVSFEDYHKYLINFYNETFVEGNLSNLTKNKEVKDNINTRYNGSEIYCINNYYHIFQLIITSMNQKSNINDYFYHFKFCNDKEYKFKMVNYFREKLNKVEELPLNNGLDKEILNAYILYARTKYGVENINVYLTSYINGNDNAITRDKEFRDKFLKYLSPMRIKQIVNNDLKTYITSVVSEKNQKADIFNKACLATYEKYGNGQLTGAIKLALTGDYCAFTNGEEKYRDNLNNLISPKEIKEIIDQTLLNNGYIVTEEDPIVDMYGEFIINQQINEEQNKNRVI